MQFLPEMPDRAPSCLSDDHCYPGTSILTASSTPPPQAAAAPASVTPSFLRPASHIPRRVEHAIQTPNFTRTMCAEIHTVHPVNWCKSFPKLPAQNHAVEHSPRRS